jgi:hypothetical protein
MPDRVFIASFRPQIDSSVKSLARRNLVFQQNRPVAARRDGLAALEQPRELASDIHEAFSVFR